MEKQVGSVDVVGPPDISLTGTCISGQRCSFDGIVGGYPVAAQWSTPVPSKVSSRFVGSLSSGDHVTVLDTCGAAGFLPGFPTAGEVLESINGSLG